MILSLKDTNPQHPVSICSTSKTTTTLALYLRNLDLTWTFYLECVFARKMDRQACNGKLRVKVESCEYV